ncbi:hypothetical protein HRbin34_00235 [bacterium HR34]|nr:hypothetical protein HRbin34_00235 [bacterium HR34]
MHKPDTALKIIDGIKEKLEKTLNIILQSYEKS